MRDIDHKTLVAIREFLALPWMGIDEGKKHAKLVVNRRTGDFIPLAWSSSEHRAARNARRLAETGYGFISAKTGRRPACTN